MKSVISNFRHSLLIENTEILSKQKFIISEIPIFHLELCCAAKFKVEFRRKESTRPNVYRLNHLQREKTS